MHINEGRPNYSEQDFLSGRPEHLIQATADKKYLLLWPHGDETLGARTGYYLHSARPELLEQFDYVCGNPVAAAHYPSVRDTSGFSHPVRGYTLHGTDLNRSYSPPQGKTQSYEQSRAAEILQLIDERGYEGVLDIHTSRSDVGACFLVSEAGLTNNAVRNIIKSSEIRRIIVLPETVPHPDDIDRRTPLVTDGLIGVRDNAISVECYRPLAQLAGLPLMMQMIDGLAANAPQFEHTERELFFVTELIPKTANLGPEAKNFEQTPDGFWPVLYGDGTYRKDPTKPYSGFAATKRELANI